jgi:hypothetical protein
VSAVPRGLLDAVCDVIARHAEELGVDRATVKRLAAPAVTARTENGGLLRLDVSAYGPGELSR